MSKLIFGIDPGLDGAIAVLSVEGQAKRLLGVFDMPTAKIRVGKKQRRRIVEPTLAAHFANTLTAHGPGNPFEPPGETTEVLAMLEEVHAMPKQGVSSTFQFGMGFGIVLGVLAALEIPVKLVTPQGWQKALRVPKGKEGARITAAREFPADTNLFSRSKDHGRADAVLIALFAASK